MVGVNVTSCKWGVLFALNAGVSLELDKESVGANAVLCTVCQDFNKSSAFKFRCLKFKVFKNRRFDSICLLFSHY